MYTPVAIAFIISLLAGCLGEVGSDRKAASEVKPTPDAKSAGGCTIVDKDVTIRSAADLAALPKSGCYEITGKLTLEGSSITSLVGLGELDQVRDLDLDRTNVTTIDTRRTLRVRGKLTAVGNPRLTRIDNVAFTSSAGVLIDGNPVLTEITALGRSDARLEKIDGDLAITGNAVLAVVALPELTQVTGAITVNGNAALKSLQLGKLTGSGHIEIADNAQLSSVTGAAAVTIRGDLAINRNPMLATLGAFGALAEVTGDVTIDNNAALTSLAAFTTAFRKIGGALFVTNNPKLADLGALKYLQSVATIKVAYNAKLSVCRAIELDMCVVHTNTSIIGANNDASCNWSCE